MVISNKVALPKRPLQFGSVYALTMNRFLASDPVVYNDYLLTGITGQMGGQQVAARQEMPGRLAIFSTIENAPTIQAKIVCTDNLDRFVANANFAGLTAIRKETGEAAPQAITDENFDKLFHGLEHKGRAKSVDGSKTYFSRAENFKLNPFGSTVDYHLIRAEIASVHQSVGISKRVPLAS